MTKLEDYVVPIIVLDDDDVEAETFMGGSASKLADSQGIRFDMKKDGDGETIMPKGGESIDGITAEVNDHAYLNGCVASEQKLKHNEHSCTIDSKSDKHGFIVGDFVWCKLKSNSWLPAQVYDLNDASKFALKYRQEGRLLVALFGDGSCSWCLPSQLLPFLENFVKMSRVCNSRSFLRAVQKAIDEFGRIVESDMICKCVPENLTGGLVRPVAENGGVKAGVLVPEVKVNRLSVPKYEPYKALTEVHHFAKTISVGNELHLAILKRWLSAFYRSKGGYQLPLYDDPVNIEGLDEKIQKLGPVANGFSPFSSDDIISQRIKMKTLAELTEEKVKVEPKSEGSLSVWKKSRKRKVEFLDSHKIKSRKPEETEVIAGEDRIVEPKQVIDNVFTPRENFSAPYKILIGCIGNSSSSKSVSKCVNNASEENLSDEKVNTKMPFPLSDVGFSVKELLVKIQSAAVKPRYLINGGSFDKVSAFVSAMKSSTYMHCSNYTIYQKYMIGQKQKKISLPFPHETLNTLTPFPLSDVGIPVNELLVKIQLAAVKPLYLSNEGSFDTVSAFVSALRSSTYIRGSNYKIYRKCISGPKQKKQMPSQSKLSPVVKTTPIKMESSITDDFISDIKFATRDLEILTVILEKYQNEFSVEEKASFKEDIKQIMEKVENVSEKVEAAKEKVKWQRKRKNLNINIG